MKFIVVLMLLHSFLFSIEKQVIVGSYLVETNAKNALVTLKQNIKKNAKLQELIKANELEVKTTKIGQYNVVSVGYFDSYIQLFRTIKELHKKYADAYTLDKGVKELKVEAVVAENFQKTPLKQEKSKTSKKVKTVESNVTKKPVEKKIATVKNEKIPQKKKNKKITPTVKKESKKPVKKVKPKEPEKNYGVYYYTIAFLIIVILLSLIISTYMKKKEKQEEE